MTSIADLVALYVDLEARRVDLVERQDGIKAQLRDVLDLGKHETEVGTVTLSPNRRFNPELAVKVLTGINPDLIAACSSTVIAAAKAKQVLPPAVYEQCMKESPDTKVAIS